MHTIVPFRPSPISPISPISFNHPTPRPSHCPVYQRSLRYTRQHFSPFAWLIMNKWRFINLFFPAPLPLLPSIMLSLLYSPLSSHSPSLSLAVSVSANVSVFSVSFDGSVTQRMQTCVDQKRWENGRGRREKRKGAVICNLLQKEMGMLVQKESGRAHTIYKLKSNLVFYDSTAVIKMFCPLRIATPTPRTLCLPSFSPITIP